MEAMNYLGDTPLYYAIWNNNNAKQKLAKLLANINPHEMSDKYEVSQKDKMVVIKLLISKKELM